MKEMFKIVELEEKYVPDVAEIEASSFSEPRSPEEVMRTINDEMFTFYCLVDDADKLYGYVGVSRCVPEAEIVSVAIKDSCRGRGYSGILLDAVLDAERVRGVTDFYLEVRESNMAALHLYKGAGFRIIGRREGFYKFPSEAALIMGLGNN